MHNSHPLNEFTILQLKQVKIKSDSLYKIHDV